MNRIQKWLWVKRVDRAERKHAEWCGRALALIAERDERLAERTWTRVREMNSALRTVPQTEAYDAWRLTRIDQVQVILDALEAVK